MSIVAQLSAYFGVFYPVALQEDVTKILAKSRFAFNGDHECETDGVLLIDSSHTDLTDPEYRFIAADDLTIAGGEREDLPGSYLRISSIAMEDLEKGYPKAVEQIGEIYALLLEGFKRRKSVGEQLYSGWNVIACEWDDGSSSSSSEPPAKAKGKAKVPVKKAPRAKSTALPSTDSSTTVKATVQTPTRVKKTTK